MGRRADHGGGHEADDGAGGPPWGQGLSTGPTLGLGAEHGADHGVRG